MDRLSASPEPGRVGGVFARLSEEGPRLDPGPSRGAKGGGRRPRLRPPTDGARRMGPGSPQRSMAPTDGLRSGFPWATTSPEPCSPGLFEEPIQLVVALAPGLLRGQGPRRLPARGRLPATPHRRNDSRQGQSAPHTGRLKVTGISHSGPRTGTLAPTCRGTRHLMSISHHLYNWTRPATNHMLPASPTSWSVPGPPWICCGCRWV